MIRVVEGVTGLPVPVRHFPARPIDVAAIVLDCTRIRQDLGWAAKRPMEVTVADVWRSMAAHAQLRTPLRRSGAA
jgi:UDP-glucose 4-epimerase